jgi:hypothetical protein
MASEDRDVARYLARLVERVQSVSGVQSVGIVNRLPLGGQAQTLTIEFEGTGALINIDSRSVSGNYFRALGIPLLAGRSFRDDDTDGRPSVGVIDERAAREAFGRDDPVGKRFRIAIVPGMPWVRIVGVAGHIRHEGLENDPRPQVYWPYGQRTQDRMAMVIKTGGNPAPMTAAVRAAIREVDPGLGFRALLPLPVSKRALGSGQYPIGDAERWRRLWTISPLSSPSWIGLSFRQSRRHPVPRPSGTGRKADGSKPS